MEFEVKKIVACGLLGVCLLTSTIAEAVGPRKGTTTPTPATEINHDAVNNFIADRVTFKKEMALKELSTINSIALNTELNEEARLYPADEWYGSWENQFVDPTRSGGDFVLPDSCNIDCSAFTYPLDTVARITSKYGPRRRRMHKGIDLKVQIGDSIRAAFDGRIRIVAFDRRGYGKYVVIRHPNGLETVYGHLSKHILRENDYVRAGDVIGLGGNTGRSTGSHLHFETRFLGQAINPAEIIDFENGVQQEDLFVFRNVKIKGRNSNIYTTSNNQAVYHRVKSGESLSVIAKRYGTTVNRLCQLNGIKATATLRLGQSLLCAGGTNKQQVEVKTDSDAKQIAKIAPTKTVSTTPKTAETAPVSEGVTVYHKIKSGDTLGALARRYKTSVDALCKMNGLTPTTRLNLGQSIRCS